MLIKHNQRKTIMTNIYRNAAEEVEVLIKNWLADKHGLWLQRVFVHSSVLATIRNHENESDDLILDITDNGDNVVLTVKSRFKKLLDHGLYLNVKGRDAHYLRELLNLDLNK